MDIDALGNRLKNLEDKVGALSPELLAEFKELFAAAQPALADVGHLLARVEDAEATAARLTEQLAQGLGDLSERLAQLELAANGETTAPDAAPPAPDAAPQPAADVEPAPEDDGQGGAPQE